MTDIAEFEQPEFDPSIEPESSKAWLNLIEDAEKAFKRYQEICDNIDKKFADLERMASAVTTDREFQLFWANIQVLGPSIYSRPPVPVVVPRFRNRKPIPRTASELLERATSVEFEQEDIDATMILIRDDLTRLARGCAWIRYEDKQKKGKKHERVCIDHVDRRDWLCAPARKWQEVDWVARRAWMTAEEMEKRFKGDKWKEAAFEENDRDQKDRGNRDPILKAGVWEIWSKSEDRVVWVTEGVDEVLDSNEPHLTLEGFFPCPRPAYATVQPGSLVPVPDYVYYKDQISEINELTGRISALSEALKLKGFYPGGGEIGDAIEAAMARSDDRAIMVPIANWAAFGGSGEQIIWLPIDMVATTVAALVDLRKQLIDDVYQITGLSDIMRGSTNANETLGAQELKSQYGSVRVRDRQNELVRIARDITRIVAEIMAENFSQKTLEEMSQMELPTDAEIKKQFKALEDQAKEITAGVKKQIAQAQSDPQIMAQAQENPEEAQKALQQIQQQAQEQLGQLQKQMQELGETVTIDQVMKLLKDQRLRPFVLDIETDSTIAPDENAQKQRAAEFITSVGGYMGQAFPLVQAMPQSAPLVADMLKYVASQFRAGRELDTTIDEFAENMKAAAAQPAPNPEADAAQATAQAEQQRLQMEQQKAQADMQAKQADAQLKMQQAQADEQRKQQAAQADIQIKGQLADHQAKLLEAKTAKEIEAIQVKAAQDAQKHQQELELGVLNIELLRTKIEQTKVSTASTLEKTQSDIDAKEAGVAISAKSAQAKAQTEGAK
ncbi:hypothetical protein [Ensifer canadensis]|uniref:hypothetical protein n=1 Tax=Ensifer canadensis TaxID=555315 RepID=UPI0035E3E01D